MTPPVRILVGDCRATLATLPAGGVHCCVTSPPYWGLRDYGAAGQLGLEASVDEYVAAMVEAFRAVRRVLRDDGVAWLNLGDTYAVGRVGRDDYRKMSAHDAATGRRPNGRSHRRKEQPTARRAAPAGLKPKDLVGVPWRVAFALQADGWYLRAAAPWIKRNPMPESTRDRPAVAHEYVFLVAKSERYYWDPAAVARPAKFPGESTAADVSRAFSRRRMTRPGNTQAEASTAPAPTRNWRSSDFYFDGLVLDDGGAPEAFVLPSQPFAGAHFATFPPRLVAPCVLAATSALGCCPACGAPWRRRLERVRRGDWMPDRAADLVHGLTRNTLGWDPGCACPAADPVPCTVLDPFAGSGTTGAVARALGRAAVLCELQPAYVPLIEARMAAPVPGLGPPPAPVVDRRQLGLFAEVPDAAE